MKALTFETVEFLKLDAIREHATKFSSVAADLIAGTWLCEPAEIQAFVDSGRQILSEVERLLQEIEVGRAENE